LGPGRQRRLERRRAGFGALRRRRGIGGQRKLWRSDRVQRQRWLRRKPRVGGTGGIDANNCPTSPPTPGRDCPIAVSASGCSYGNSVLPECRKQWQCQCVSAHPGVQCSWVSGNVAMTCAATDAAACPATAPVQASDGGLPGCTAAVGTRCGYQDGTICKCSSCLEVGGPCQPVNPPRWSCSSPPLDSTCPRTIPNAGSSCTRVGLECVYDAACGVRARCENARWIWTRLQCPQ
jgi:hypothetical protein